MKSAIFSKQAARMLLSLCISLLLSVTLISALPTAGEEQIYDRVIRLHVLANSDTEEDQALKLRVRDAILQYLDTLSDTVQSSEDAEALYAAHLPELEGCAKQVIADAGYRYDCRVTLTRESYPIRTYDAGDTQYTLPAGAYRSLRVMIGEAAGQNWWCVLFPPLCLSLAAEQTLPADGAIPVSVDETEEMTDTDSLLLAAGFTPYEISLISGEQSPKIVVKFRIVEWLRRLLTK